jgi:tRNA(His) 5'-end guanylyltransferase
MPQFQFDCKAWNLPTENDVFAWFLYRQLDCIRNSKLQTAQTYCSHKELMSKNSDEQVKLLKEKLDINWNDFEDSKKFGRFVWKETEPFYNESLDVHYDRSVWKSHPAWELSNQEGKTKLLDILFQKDGIEQH